MHQLFHRSKRPMILFLYLLWGFLFVFFYLTIGSLNTAGNIRWTGNFIAKTMLLSLLLGSALSFFARLLSAQIGKLFSGQRPPAITGSISLRTTTVCGLIIALFQIPGWLAFYPGICAYDTPVQILQIVSGAYNDHHPLLHTLLLQLFLHLGEALGSSTNAIALYTFLQLILLSFACGYSIAFCGKLLVSLGIKKKGILCFSAGMTVLCIIFPFQSFLSISVTKDIPFTFCFMVMVVTFLDLILYPGQASPWRYLCLFFSTLGIIVFRNNGIYALLVPILFLLIGILRQRKRNVLDVKPLERIFVCLVTSLLLGILLLKLLFQVTDADSADRREMLSLPIQQLARVMIYHGGIGMMPEDTDTLSPQEKNIINDFLLNESYRLYNPSISDPVKRNTNTSVLLRRTKEFFSTYLRLGITYPGDYVNAALGTMAGYLSPGDTSHATINLSESETGLGYVQTRWEESFLQQCGIRKESKWQSLHDLMYRWASENGYLNIPVFGYLLRPGNFLWFFLFLAILFLEKKNYSAFLPLLLILAYLATLLLGPTVQLRYIYPAMMVVPAFFFTAIRSQNDYQKE